MKATCLLAPRTHSSTRIRSPSMTRLSIRSWTPSTIVRFDPPPAARPRPGRRPKSGHRGRTRRGARSGCALPIGVCNLWRGGKVGPGTRPTSPREDVRRCQRPQYLTATGVAAATGSLPDGVQRVAAEVLSKVGITVPDGRPFSREHPTDPSPAAVEISLPSDATVRSDAAFDEVTARDAASAEPSVVDKRPGVSTPIPDDLDPGGGAESPLATTPGNTPASADSAPLELAMAPAEQRVTADSPPVEPTNPPPPSLPASTPNEPSGPPLDDEPGPSLDIQPEPQPDLQPGPPPNVQPGAPPDNRPAPPDNEPGPPTHDSPATPSAASLRPSNPAGSPPGNPGPAAPAAGDSSPGPPDT